MNTITSAVPEQLAQHDLGNREPVAKSNELGQDEFLKLMLTQIKYQDPMKPMENGEFIGQMAQFSTVSGIEKMNASIESLSSAYGSSQTLQASQLIGREVLLSDNTLELDASESGAGGRFDLDASSGSVTVDVMDPGGSLVRRMSLGQQAAGPHDFHWDGRDDNGDPVAAGTYNAVITAEGANGDDVSLPVLVARLVGSVEFDPDGQVTLATDTGDTFNLSDIRQIRPSRSTAE